MATKKKGVDHSGPSFEYEPVLTEEKEQELNARQQEVLASSSTRDLVVSALPLLGEVGVLALATQNPAAAAGAQVILSKLANRLANRNPNNEDLSLVTLGQEISALYDLVKKGGNSK